MGLGGGGPGSSLSLVMAEAETAAVVELTTAGGGGNVSSFTLRGKNLELRYGFTTCCGGGGCRDSVDCCDEDVSSISIDCDCDEDVSHQSPLQ